MSVHTYLHQLGLIKISSGIFDRNESQNNLLMVNSISMEGCVILVSLYEIRYCLSRNDYAHVLETGLKTNCF